MINKTLLLFPLLVVSLPLVWILGSTSHNEILTVDKKTGDYIPKEINPEEEAESLPPPKAVIDQTSHHFGLMDPFEIQQHRFVIRNEGEGPLKVRRGGTSCKCTEFKILHRVIEPGGEGVVLVEWQTIYERGPFHETATIRTNDPENESIRLSVQGTIVRTIATDPPNGLQFGRIPPGHSRSVSLVLYSQEWEQFEIEKIECELPGLTWKVGQPDANRLEKLEASIGRLITFTVPGDLSSKTHQYPLRFHVRKSEAGDDGEELMIHETIAYAFVPSRLSVSGPPIKTTVDGRGVIELGKLESGQSRRAHLVIKVNDKDPLIKLRDIETDPEFVKAWLEPFNEQDNRGLYHFYVEIPKTAPICYYNGLRSSRLRLWFEHPRIEKLELYVTFAVIDQLQ